MGDYDDRRFHNGQNRECDIAYFTAKPLIKTRNGKNTVAGELDVMEYVIRMRLLLQEQKRRVRFTHVYATKSSLRNTLHKPGCKVLHFTLHGSATMELIVEHETMVGHPSNLSLEEVRQIFAARKPKLVVILSKHAETGARFFEQVGIEHVVALRYEYVSKDQAVREFKKQFYSFLLSGYSVRQAFENALEETRTNLRMQQGFDPEKFWIRGTAANHDEIIFPPNSLPKGKMVDLTDISGNYRLPMSVQNFVGRNQSIFEVLQSIQKNRTRLTWVYGTQGFGKTGLVVMAAHYLKERKVYKNIFYVDAVASPEDKLAQVVGQVFRGDQNQDQEELYAEMNELMYLVHASDYHNKSCGNNPMSNRPIYHTEDLCKVIMDLKEEVLLILDSVTQKFELSQMVTFCQVLLNSCRNLRLLVCSRVGKGLTQIVDKMIQDHKLSKMMNGLKCIDMKPMNEHAALRLLLHTRPPQTLQQEFGNISAKEIEKIVAEHPCGRLARKYHVPQAVKQIAARMDSSHSFFYTVTTNALELIIKELVPFHVYLHRGEGHNYSGNIEVLRRNELSKFDQLPNWALDLLNNMTRSLFRYQKAHRPASLPHPTVPYQHGGYGFPGPSAYPPTLFGHQPGFGAPGTQLGATPGFVPQNSAGFHPSFIQHHSQPFTNYTQPSVGTHFSHMGSTTMTHTASSTPGSTAINTMAPLSSDEDDCDEDDSYEEEVEEEAQPARSYTEWTTDELIDWLITLGPVYGKYGDAIRQNGLDGGTLLLMKDDDALEELGITLSLHKRVIKKKIELLEKEESDK